MGSWVSYVETLKVRPYRSLLCSMLNIVPDLTHHRLPVIEESTQSDRPSAERRVMYANGAFVSDAAVEANTTNLTGSGNTDTANVPVTAATTSGKAKADVAPLPGTRGRGRKDAASTDAPAPRKSTRTTKAKAPEAPDVDDRLPDTSNSDKRPQAPPPAHVARKSTRTAKAKALEALQEEGSGDNDVDDELPQAPPPARQHAKARIEGSSRMAPSGTARAAPTRRTAEAACEAPPAAASEPEGDDEGSEYSDMYMPSDELAAEQVDELVASSPTPAPRPVIRKPHAAPAISHPPVAVLGQQNASHASTEGRGVNPGANSASGRSTGTRLSTGSASEDPSGLKRKSGEFAYDPEDVVALIRACDGNFVPRPAQSNDDRERQRPRFPAFGEPGFGGPSASSSRGVPDPQGSRAGRPTTSGSRGAPNPPESWDVEIEALHPMQLPRDVWEAYLAFKQSQNRR